MAGLLDMLVPNWRTPQQNAQEQSRATGLLGKILMRGADSVVGYPSRYGQTYQPGQSVQDNPAATNWAAAMALNMVGTPGGTGGLGSGARMSGGALPMDEASRAARAAEQGFTIDAYKGMPPYHPDTVPSYYGSGRVVPGTENRVPAELTEIDARKIGNGGAGFFSSDPAVASRFAEIMRGSVYPTKLRMSNPKVIDAEGRHAADFQFGKGAGQLDLPKDSPHDGVILKNTKDEGDVYIPRASEQIRSRFAAFNPANEGSSHLLGSGGTPTPWATPQQDSQRSFLAKLLMGDAL